ncbi:hypothetical protein [Vibrio campbellii]|uniref:hypothetical protein n=1 Tax=Vibrio campbellii TaxID=680 RepID=UPI0038CD8FF0
MSPYKLIKLSVLCVCLISNSANATIVHTFTPEVTIFKDNNFGDIEITGKRDYQALYDTKLQAFKPLNIDFGVKNRSGEILEYSLTLPVSQHYCEGNSGLVPLNGLSFTLDGKPFAPTNSDEGGHGGQTFSGSVHQHRLEVQYPNLPQSGDNQQCYGVLGLSAEVKL